MLLLLRRGSDVPPTEPEAARKTIGVAEKLPCDSLVGQSQGACAATEHGELVMTAGLGTRPTQDAADLHSTSLPPRLAGLRACALAGPLFSLNINCVRVPCPTSGGLSIYLVSGLP